MERSNADSPVSFAVAQYLREERPDHDGRGIDRTGRKPIAMFGEDSFDPLRREDVGERQAGLRQEGVHHPLELLLPPLEKCGKPAMRKPSLVYVTVHQGGQSVFNRGWSHQSTPIRSLARV
jgi:hypothetical protein